MFIFFVFYVTMSSSAQTPQADPEIPRPSSTQAPKKQQRTLDRDYFNKRPVVGASLLRPARPLSPPPRGLGCPKHRKCCHPLNRDYLNKRPVAGASLMGLERPSSLTPGGPGRPKHPFTESAATPEPATYCCYRKYVSRTKAVRQQK